MVSVLVPAIVTGPLEPQLVRLSLGQLLQEQATTYPDQQAVISSWTGVRYTYRQLLDRCKTIARALIALGVKRGDRVGILSGNCERYIELFFATTLIGGIVVVLNNTYTPKECINALDHSGCRLLFTSTQIGKKSMLPHLEVLASVRWDGKTVLSYLKNVILIRSLEQPIGESTMSYDEFIMQGAFIKDELDFQIKSTHFMDVANLQYTSGTTGQPKAAMLTHHNIINNGRFIGNRMKLTRDDVICCPPPLFHCFGLVLGLLACFTHGASLVLPNESFEPAGVIEALIKENCTGLHGVPTMFIAELDYLRQHKIAGIALRTGIAAGSPVSPALMTRLQQVFGLRDLTITYGMTETSPASFMTSIDDALEEKLSTVGRILPHTTAKVVNMNNEIVPFGTAGELVVAGYNLQVGYFNDPEKTKEVMVKDGAGVLWMRTGDEVVLDERGYCKITGRIKDIIIRGGENIYPLEVEERLTQHPAIIQAAVVGLQDQKYGEIPAAFLEPDISVQRPLDSQLQDWVRLTLGRHKVPVKLFWLGDVGVCHVFPTTGSGKLKKNELRDLGNKLISLELHRST
ncbi:4-coumarate-CoA ligase [Phlyctema vagabunda]|uniref:4-coumarate-CoA ligase n=1 Tax=Phlyctema vagabunda TaxID=108571 RepID=A0ABR4PWA5_9HELO